MDNFAALLSESWLNFDDRGGEREKAN